jgi:hypothetical protein
LQINSTGEFNCFVCPIFTYLLLKLIIINIGLFDESDHQMCVRDAQVFTCADAVVHDECRNIVIDDGVNDNPKPIDANFGCRDASEHN